jgi:fimbrial chaperone protein
VKLLKPIIIACSMAILPLVVDAGEFQVSPIMMDLGKTAKSGVVTVSNVGNEKINLQVQAMAWKQDNKGKDHYSDSTDIVYFPKIISLEKGGGQMIRVGMKGAPPQSEKTYRLYIEEIPQPRKAEKGKAQVAIAIRFGVPVFIKPASESLKGLVDPITVVKGTATALVRNTGNVHFRITTVTITGRTADGQQVFTKEIKGWYLLAGAERSYSAPIPLDVCRRLEQIQFDIKADVLTLSGSHHINKEMCLP